MTACYQCPHQGEHPPSATQLQPPHPLSHPSKITGSTYIFFNVLRLHSLVGIICRVKGAKYKPAEKREEKGEM
jgi:hypothetical protein